MRLDKYQYLIMSLDPIHVGTGGYRIGRVDNAIVREPATNLPKIPGSSLHGSIRSASAMYYGKPTSAGQKPKGDPGSDPIVYAFGAGEGEESGFRSGVVSISDAQIVLFPVASQNGPVWITTSNALEGAGFTLTETPAERPTRTPVRKPSSMEKVLIGSKLSGIENRFPLGWLMFEIEANIIGITPSDSWRSENVLNETLERTVVVHEGIFSELVNSGLEVRTSVAINPRTGAAEHGALFTYEAIPRATFLAFDVVIDDYYTGKKPWPVEKMASRIEKDDGGKVSIDYRDNSGPRLDTAWGQPKDVLDTGCSLLEYLGIGGMGTRGFGRMRVIAKARPCYHLAST